MENKLFDELLDLALSKGIITQEDLKSSKREGFKVEDFLNWLNREKEYLFHGSGTLISLDQKLSSKSGKLHATDDGGVAIIKALFANNIPGQTNLDYKLDKSGNQEVIISGNPEKEVTRQKGYVYVLENEGFSNENTQGVAEYIKPFKEGEKQDYLFVIEIEWKDFNYSYRMV